MSDYNDGKIECAATSLRIHGYYFPYGTKDIPYSAIKGLRRFQMSGLRGKMRIWGTGNFKYWANLDVKRPTKAVGFIVETGKSVQPFISPDEPDAFETVLRERAGLGPNTGDTTAPFV
jgi:hypothetical protein